MAADRWAKCPKCTEKLQATLDSTYDKVSEDEYLDALRQVNQQDETMREDYELWTDEHGKFTVNYSCNCKECGFAFEYHHSERILPENY